MRKVYRVALWWPGLALAAGLGYLSYRSFAWGFERGDFGDIWSGVLAGLLVGGAGLWVLALTIAGIVIGITDWKPPAVPNTGSRPRVWTGRGRGSGRSAGAELDGGDWVD